MDKILDLKKKTLAIEESEAEHRRASPTTNEAPILPHPVQVVWVGQLSDSIPNMKAVGAFSLFLLVVGAFFIFWQKNIFAAGFFIAAAGLLLSIAKKHQPETNFVVGPLSIKVGPIEYAFKDIKSFWIEYQVGGVRELSLQLKHWYFPYLKIPLYDQNPVQVRIILLKFIPEVEHQETLLNTIQRWLGV